MARLFRVRPWNAIEIRSSEAHVVVNVPDGQEAVAQINRVVPYLASARQRISELGYQRPLSIVRMTSKLLNLLPLEAYKVNQFNYWTLEPLR